VTFEILDMILKIQWLLITPFFVYLDEKPSKSGLNLPSIYFSPQDFEQIWTCFETKTHEFIILNIFSQQAHAIKKTHLF
jgi:hypothetical protein